ncbi:CbrC family protein [Streptomyces sp. NPDC037389]|uniref:CbrC family protein n=1 Tax=Streptomyces sp. NPDC037389 TaxID=3155369 RepID=UPI0033F09568
MTDALPDFPYHPDPLATASVVVSKTACACCGQERGYAYTGPVYAVEKPDGRLCPWCIADGTAAARYEAHFSGDVEGDDVPREVLLAIAERTPGFTGWQDERWLLHCGDGAAFLGRVGAVELADHPDALESLRQGVSHWGWSADQIDHFLGSLDKDGQPTAYLFRCRTCAAHLAYADFT